MNKRKRIQNPKIQHQVIICCECGIFSSELHRNWISLSEEKNIPKWIKEQYEDEWVRYSDKPCQICGCNYFYCRILQKEKTEIALIQKK